MRRAVALLALVLAVLALSCNGTTGDDLLTFQAFASGVPGAAEPFTAGNFTIQFTAVEMHIGALYFDESPPSTGFDTPLCIASGVYAAQVPGPVDVDLLSTAPQTFRVYGNGTADTALSWQVWLTDDTVGQDNIDVANVTPIVRMEGVATNAAGQSFPFGAVVTINSNRSTGGAQVATPGNDPVCKLRVVQIGGLDLRFFPGGVLRVTVDPRKWFTEQSNPIDFSRLPPITDPTCNQDTLLYTPVPSYALQPETPPPSTQTCGGSAQPCCPPLFTCDGGLTCNEDVCGPAYCIPNSSNLSGGDLGGTYGDELFKKITSGDPFSVQYSEH
jgi:hypothetical protein